MTVAVVDTNVLASGLVRGRYESPPNIVVRLWQDGAFELATSDAIYGELTRTLLSPYFAQRVPREDREAFLVLLWTRADNIELITSVANVATHVEDDAILATALNANADYLVTGDKALLELGTFEGTRIVSAADFVAIIEAS